MKLSAILLLILPAFSVSTDVLNADGAKEFLEKFSYLEKCEGCLLDERTYLAAIENYQKNMGLKVTGRLDLATKYEMMQPRCGVPDASMARRSKRYATHGSRWRKNQITYKITGYTPDLNQEDVDRTIADAFKVWEEVSPLRFSVTTGKPDIQIYFAPGEHGDGDKFDGSGGVLAHAFFPRFGGDAHFDEGEKWTIKTYSGVNLFQVAAHEFGHSLGLSHSGSRPALMFPTYRGYQPKFKLDTDDISGIQSLYPMRGVTPPPRRTPRPTRRTLPPATRKPYTPRPTRPTTTKRIPTAGNPLDACKVDKWDAVTTTHNGETFFFAGAHYYKINPTDPEESRQPHRISEGWSFVPDNIDAAVTLSSGYTLLLKDDVFHLFVGQKRTDKYMRYTKYYLKGMPGDLDAGFVWPTNDKFYGTRSASYWRYNSGNAQMDRSYPRSFQKWWPGAPATLDAADTVEGTVHFFKSRAYYTFNDKTDKTEGPRSIGEDFFKCPAEFTQDDLIIEEEDYESVMPPPQEPEVDDKDSSEDDGNTADFGDILNEADILKEEVLSGSAAFTSPAVVMTTVLTFLAAAILV